MGETMKTSTLLKTGLVGTMLAALCCFTPALVILLGAIGLSAWVGHLDAVLLPALVIFMALTIYALIRKDKGKG
jgi:mercuric ion transport protein